MWMVSAASGWACRARSAYTTDPVSDGESEASARPTGNVRRRRARGRASRMVEVMMVSRERRGSARLHPLYPHARSAFPNGNGKHERHRADGVHEKAIARPPASRVVRLAHRVG